MKSDEFDRAFDDGEDVTSQQCVELLQLPRPLLLRADH